MKFDISPLLNQDLLDLRSVFQANGFDLRFVGGCVRDHVIGRTPKDVDLCTDAGPVEQIAIYEQHNIKHIPTGIDHGTITVVMNDRVYEITSLRLDVATDGRRATVAYTRDWTEDAARRDFTINAMSFTFDGTLIDPFNGHSDLKKGLVQFVGDADQRIKEDYLRILRWFRFRARFGYDTSSWQGKPHPNSEQIIANAAGLEQISRERIWSEIKQILSGPNGPYVMADIHMHRCATPIGLPDFGPFISKSVNDFHARINDPIANLYCLYGSVTTSQVLEKWKASREEQDFANFIIKERWTTKADGYYLLAVAGYPRDWVLKLADICDVDEFEKFMLEGWVIPEFPVNGYDLMKMGMKPGPHYKRALDLLKEIWAMRGFVSTKEELLESLPAAMR